MNTILKTATMLSATFIMWSSAEAGPKEAAESAAKTASDVVVKVERAIERGARAAASGVEHGAKAAASGIERGAKATGSAANRVAKKVGASPASSPATGK